MVCGLISVRMLLLVAFGAFQLLLLFFGVLRPYAHVTTATLPDGRQYWSHRHKKHPYLFPGAACVPTDSGCRHLDPRWHQLLGVVPHGGGDPPLPQPQHWAEAAAALAQAAHVLEIFDATAAPVSEADASAAGRCAELAGMPMEEQLDTVLRAAAYRRGRANGTVLWPLTLLDASYSSMAGEIDAMMRKARLPAPLFVAMDDAGWAATCLRGRQAVRLSEAEGGVSVKARVEYAKFIGTALLLERGFHVLLFEADVWMVAPMQHLFADTAVDVFLPTHLNNPFLVNIGLWYARPERGAARLFRTSADLLKADPGLYDQDVFTCLAYGQRMERAYPAHVPQTEVEFAYKNFCTPNVQRAFPQYQDFGLTVRALPNDAIVCNVAIGMSTDTLAVHVLSDTGPLQGAAKKMTVAKGLGVWVGSGGYYDGPRRYLAVSGWISSSVSPWHYNRNGELERAWLTFLSAAALATNRTLILPSIFQKVGSVSAWEVLALGSLPLDWRPAAFLLHPEVQAVAEDVLFPMAVLRATEGLVEWASWRSSAELEVSLEAAGGGESAHRWARHETNGMPPEHGVWGPMLREAEVHSAELLVLDIDFAASAIPDLLSLASGNSPAGAPMSEEADLLLAVSRKATWCHAQPSDDVHSYLQTSRVCV
eukprot:jgi/Tetstr1/436884/TSEL_025660.t1